MNANLDGATIQQAAQAARAALPAGTGFMLMAFQPGPCGTRKLEYASNMKLEEVKEAMSAFLDQARTGGVKLHLPPTSVGANGGREYDV